MSSRAKPSFSKALFSGVLLDELVFPYPKMDEEEKENLKLIQETFKKFADDHIDSYKIDEEGRIPDEVMDGLKELGFMGLSVPEEYGGFGLSNTGYVKMLEFIGGINPSVAIVLGGHQSIGYKGLLLYGTEQQKKKYLPKLASGEMIAAYCLTEPGAGSDAAGIKTKAVLDEKRGVYVLNGSKLWITNGGIADFFTVFAKEMVPGKDGKPEEKISAFIVTRDMGVQSGKEENKLGLKGSSTTELFFDNVEVPVENLLGERGKGFKVAMNILNAGRLGLAGGSLGALKYIMTPALEHIRQRRQFNKTLSEFEMIKEKVAQMTIDIFATESMIYLASDFMDRGDVDYSLESAMCKIRATEVAWNGINECLQMVGGLGFMKEYPYQLYMRDGRVNMIFEGTNEILRMFIALAGVHERAQYLKKLGAALKGPIKGFGVLTDYASQWLKGRVVTERIRDVHPALANAKANFETWAKNTHFSAERFIMHYGKNIIYKEMRQERLANAVIDLFGMIATISRVDTLIKEKGEENCKYEIMLCNAFADQAWRRVRRNLLMMDSNLDKEMNQISDYLVQQGRYPFATEAL